MLTKLNGINPTNSIWWRIQLGMRDQAVDKADDKVWNSVWNRIGWKIRPKTSNISIPDLFADLSESIDSAY